MPKQIIIIGGGLSINDGIEKGLWEKINGRFTIAINYAFRYLDPTAICFLDVKFQKHHGNEFADHPLKISRQGAEIKEDESTWLLPVNSSVYTGKESFTKGMYTPFLTGIFAVSLALQLLEEKGEIFLLGYDSKSEVTVENGKKKIVNNFHGDATLPQTFDYNEYAKADRNFGQFKNLPVKIWNVCLDSGINVFDKISYDEFFDKLDNNLFNQDHLRKEVIKLLPKKPEKPKKPEAVNVITNGEYPDPILITGCPLSGGSLLAKTLADHGIFGGNNFEIDEKYYENVEIKEKVVKSFLRSIDCDPLGQTTIPETSEMLKLEDKNRRENVLELMKAQGLKPGQMWFFKDSKICLDWPVWQKAFPNAKWIVVNRNDNALATEYVKNSFMKACGTQAEWLEWLKSYKAKLNEIKINCETQEVYVENIINGDEPLIRLFTWLGLELNPDLAQDFNLRKLSIY